MKTEDDYGGGKGVGVCKGIPESFHSVCNRRKRCVNFGGDELWLFDSNETPFPKLIKSYQGFGYSNKTLRVICPFVPIKSQKYMNVLKFTEPKLKNFKQIVQRVVRSIRGGQTQSELSQN